VAPDLRSGPPVPAESPRRQGFSGEGADLGTVLADSSLHGWPPPIRPNPRRAAMLHYALVFLVVALIAAALGFGGLAGAAAGIAKILFFVFLVLFVASLLFGGLRRG